MTSAFSWQNLLVFALLHFELQGQTFLLLQLSLDILLCIPILYDEKDMFSLVLILGLVGLHRTSHLQLLWHQWLGIDLEYCDVEWFAWETN